MSSSQKVVTRAPRVRRRLFREQSRVGKRISVEVCAMTRRAPGFRMPAAARWRRDLDFHGLQSVGPGLPQARRLLGWARSRPGRADGRVSRRWVARALIAAYRRHPEERTIAAGGQWIADEVLRRGGPRISRQTAQRVVQEMIADGVLFMAERGCSAAITGTRNHVSVYVVVEPAALSEADQELFDQLAARLVGNLPVGLVTRVKEVGSPARRSGRIDPEPPGPQRREHPERYAPRNSAERAAALAWLIADQGWQRFEGRARAELPRIAARFFAAGWSARALAVALGRRPDGTEHNGPLQGVRQHDRRSPIRTRNLWAVVTWRLSLWKVDGDPTAAVDQPRRGRPKTSAVLPTAPARTQPGSVALALFAQYGFSAGALRSQGMRSA